MTVRIDTLQTNGRTTDQHFLQPKNLSMLYNVKLPLSSFQKEVPISKQ